MNYSKRYTGLIIKAVAILAFPAVISTAQPPTRGGQAPASGDPTARFVDRIMEMDKNKDGKLQRTEVTDPRMLGMYDKIDTGKKGFVTKAQLTDYMKKNMGNMQGGGMGRFERPKPGTIMSAGMQDRLKLTADQKAKVAAIQKDVDAKLAKILTADQKKEMANPPMRGGMGGPGGPGGMGGPGGGPGGPGGPGGGGRRPGGV